MLVNVELDISGYRTITSWEIFAFLYCGEFVKNSIELAIQINSLNRMNTAKVKYLNLSKLGIN